ncbi:MAG: hypothetical protein ABJL55_04075 [Roseibium sp.]
MIKVKALAGVFFLFVCPMAHAATCGVDTTWRVSFAELPNMDQRDGKNFLINFVKEIVDEAGVEIKYDIVPFKRSILNVATGRADMHLPFLQPDGNAVINEKLKYSDAVFFEVPFNVYMSAKSDFAAGQIDTKNAIIETFSAHKHFFSFPVTASDCLECSLNKVILGRIDAFIYAAASTDSTIKKLGIDEQIRREHYKSFPSKAVLPRTPCGEAFNAKLNALVPDARRTATHPAFRIGPPEITN